MRRKLATHNAHAFEFFFSINDDMWNWYFNCSVWPFSASSLPSSAHRLSIAITSEMRVGEALFCYFPLFVLHASRFLPLFREKFTHTTISLIATRIESFSIVQKKWQQSIVIMIHSRLAHVRPISNLPRRKPFPIQQISIPENHQQISIAIVDPIINTRKYQYILWQ